MIALLVVATTIGVVQWWVQRKIHTIEWSGRFGIQLILTPVGFGLFGWDLPWLGAAPFIIGGLAALLYSMKKQLAAAGDAT